MRRKTRELHSTNWVASLLERTGLSLNLHQYVDSLTHHKCRGFRNGVSFSLAIRCGQCD